ATSEAGQRRGLGRKAGGRMCAHMCGGPGCGRRLFSFATAPACTAPTPSLRRPSRGELVQNCPPSRQERHMAPSTKIAEEARRRRTFAIISHPDAGKTTTTEKILLYSGAIHLAGSVKARRARRHAVSDWMAIEKERGISVTSSVLAFEYEGLRINLLDTPGHQDFGEDTYRTLMAADAAIMLLDNAKGVEPQTKKLFHVCRLRR